MEKQEPKMHKQSEQISTKHKRRADKISPTIPVTQSMIISFKQQHSKIGRRRKREEKKRDKRRTNQEHRLEHCKAEWRRGREPESEDRVHRFRRRW